LTTPPGLAVVVGIELEAGRLGRREQRIVERVLVGHGRDLSGPTCRGRCCRRRRRSSRSGEQRRDLAPAPAARPPTAPRCVIERWPSTQTRPLIELEPPGIFRGTGIWRLACPARARTGSTKLAAGSRCRKSGSTGGLLAPASSSRILLVFTESRRQRPPAEPRD